MATEEPKYEKVILNRDIVIKNLSNVDKSADGSTFHLTRLNLSEARLEALNNVITEFKFIKDLDLSLNNIVEIALLASLENLENLNLRGNKIKNVNIFTNEDNFKQLNKLDVSNNKFTDLPSIKLSKLLYLNISENRIDKFENWTGHPNLKILVSNDNRFRNLTVIKDLPQLRELYFNSNPITTLNGYENIPELRKLSVRRAKIEKIEDEFQDLPNMHYLNLRDNRISSMEHVIKLFQYSGLKVLSLIDNPVHKKYADESIFRCEILSINPKIERFNKVEITDKEKMEAIYYAEYKWRKQEEERIRKEKEEKEREEQENNND